MSTDRPATTDPVDPLCRAGQCGHERHALPDPLQPPRPMTDEEAAEFERRWSATVPPRASEAPRGEGSPTPDVGAAQGGEGGSAAESEPRVHYEVEMYNDGWSIPIYRTDSVDDARAHEEPAVTSASTRIVRVTREVIQ